MNNPEPVLEKAISFHMVTDFNQESTQAPKNYGVDISILTAMIERDLL